MVYWESHITINADTRCCAVYGFPIRDSASPAMSNAAFAAPGRPPCPFVQTPNPAAIRTFLILD